jgi:hypothetical protein
MRCSSNHMTLGELTAALKRKDREADVTFGLDYFRPSCVDSYRGYYEDLAIGFSNNTDCTVAQLIAMLEAANGKTFTGWKGGQFTMDDDTAMWAANPGRTGSMAIVDVVEVGHQIWLKTEMVP